MKLTVMRCSSQGGATIGKLFIDSVFACYTLEDEIREVLGQPVAQWKVKGATAIPAGAYRVSLENSPRFGPDTLTINDVPGFDYIRMHAGNSPADTEGCLVLGMRATAVSIVGGTSRPAVAMVTRVVRQALARGETVQIHIDNPSTET